jgi:hypothetical protein
MQILCEKGKFFIVYLLQLSIGSKMEDMAEGLRRLHTEGFIICTVRQILLSGNREIKQDGETGRLS